MRAIKLLFLLAGLCAVATANVDRLRLLGQAIDQGKAEQGKAGGELPPAQAGQVEQAGQEQQQQQGVAPPNPVQGPPPPQQGQAQGVMMQDEENEADSSTVTVTDIHEEDNDWQRSNTGWEYHSGVYWHCNYDRGHARWGHGGDWNSWHTRNCHRRRY